MTSATYSDPWAGEVPVRLVPMPSDKTRFWWKNASGCVVGGQARALPHGRCVAYAKWHASFSNVAVVAQ